MIDSKRNPYHGLLGKKLTQSFTTYQSSFESYLQPNIVIANQGGEAMIELSWTMSRPFSFYLPTLHCQEVICRGGLPDGF